MITVSHNGHIYVVLVFRETVGILLKIKLKASVHLNTQNLKP